MASDGERQLATELHEQSAKDLFPVGLSPEEYAAREGVNWGCFSFAEYRYRDPQLDTWIQRLGEIFFTPGLMQHYQETLLTPDELAEVRQRASEEF